MIIKVCGMRDANNIRQLELSHIAEWMGLIFYPKSSRYVTQIPEYLPEKMKRIGVFVNPSQDEIYNKVHDFHLTGIQLHGQESPSFIRSLKEIPILIKAFNIATADDLQLTDNYEGLCNYYLFDTKCVTTGGSGKQFDWNLLQNYKGKTPFLLSGGIGPGSIDQLAGFHHPMWAGIDLNSCFELSPAMKDITLLTHFCKEFKAIHL